MAAASPPPPLALAPSRTVTLTPAPAGPSRELPRAGRALGAKCHLANVLLARHLWRNARLFPALVLALPPKRGKRPPRDLALLSHHTLGQAQGVGGRAGKVIKAAGLTLCTARPACCSSERNALYAQALLRLALQAGPASLLGSAGAG